MRGLAGSRRLERATSYLERRRPERQSRRNDRTRDHVHKRKRSSRYDASRAHPETRFSNSHSKKNAPKGVHVVALVDLRGIEPLTSSMPRKRAGVGRNLWRRILSVAWTRPPFVTNELFIGHRPETRQLAVSVAIDVAGWHTSLVRSAAQRNVALRSRSTASPELGLQHSGVACSASSPLATPGSSPCPAISQIQPEPHGIDQQTQESDRRSHVTHRSLQTELLFCQQYTQQRGEGAPGGVNG
jgi:hypothetical protein